MDVNENKMVVENTDEVQRFRELQEPERFQASPSQQFQYLESFQGQEPFQESEQPKQPAKQTPTSAAPKPVLMRMVMLFGAAVGCLLVGVVVSIVTDDMVLLAMSAILGVSFIVKGAVLKRKISLGQIYSVSGVCVSIVPKILGRYRRIELIDTDTGDDVSFILPKKVVFKIGHVYNCYFDNQIGNHPLSLESSRIRFIKSDLNLPTNGFLGFEDFGVYHEKSTPTTAEAQEGIEKLESLPKIDGIADREDEEDAV